MKLKNKGTYWIWEESPDKRAFDEKVLQAQRKFNDYGRSIWGTRCCEMCGACCYKFQIQSLGKEKGQNHSLCPYQQITESSVCKRQENKPIECENYGCWRREYKMGTSAERYAMMLIAIEILHTKKESDLLEVLKIAEGLPSKT